MPPAISGNLLDKPDNSYVFNRSAASSVPVQIRRTILRRWHGRNLTAEEHARISRDFLSAALDDEDTDDDVDVLEVKAAQCAKAADLLAAADSGQLAALLSPAAQSVWSFVP